MMSEIENYTMTDLVDVDDYSNRLWSNGLATFPPAIVTCAITGSHANKINNPNIPLTIQEQVQSAYESYKAGAAMVHVHCRDPKDTSVFTLEAEYYREVNAKIREKCPDLIINNTAVCGRTVKPDMTFSDPMTGSIDACAEVNSIDITSYFVMLKRTVEEGNEARKEMYELGYSLNHSEAILNLEKMKKLGIKPEFECFGLSDLRFLVRLIREGYTDPFGAPHWVQYVMSETGSWPTPEFISVLKQSVPPNSFLGLVAVGAAQFPLLAQMLIIGAHVRVGMEDNVYLGKGKLADSNAQLVEKIINIANDLGRTVATCEQARQMLGLGAPRKY